MRRIVIILAGFGLAFGAIAGLNAAGYLLGGWVESFFPGAHRLTNILVLVLGFVMVIASLLTVAERKWSALMQDRVGPNRAKLGGFTFYGIGHFLADGLKMIFKEDFKPEKANTFLFNLAPMLAFAPVLCLFAIVPAGPSIEVFGHRIDMVAATPDFGILWLFAIASLTVYGTALAGWASNSKFSLLGGVRASAQMIAYEVALGLSLVGIFMAFSSVQLPALVGEVLGQGQFRYLWGNDAAMTGNGGFDFGLPAWGLFLQPLGFLLFFAASLAETKRAPFDVPEGESEIIGYFVEYSGMKFGLFMISEFAEIVTLSGVLTVLFLGGYHLPFGEVWLRGLPLFVEHQWLLGVVLGTVFWAKVLALVYLQLAIRWTFPRFRYDQIQSLGWKMLLPAGLVNVFATGALVLWDPSLRWLAIVGLAFIGVVVALSLSSPASEAAHEEGHGHGHGHGDEHGHGEPAHAPALSAHAATTQVGGHGAHVPSTAAASSH